MKKAIILALVLGLVAGALSAPAMAKKKKKKPARVERTVEARYEFPAGIGAGDVGGACSGCPTFPTGAGEIYAMVEVKDDLNSQPTGISLSWDTDGNGVNDTSIDVCGATTEALGVPENTAISAFPYVVPSVSCPGGAATSGTIKVTYSNKL
ncbi:MAG: hypothetical protein H0U53_00805 [Actinobacteria bacterium]|nr:hypothetical protein [Actinomycetota bacterium]